MSRARAMSKSDRAALVDALRHMRGSGVRHVDLKRVAGTKVRKLYAKSGRGVGARP